jgi:glycosyltransferase involved in cell wall biosynthesis
LPEAFAIDNADTGILLEVKIRFITATPLNVIEGSGTYVGIDALAKSLRNLGVTVDIVAPRRRFSNFTVHRLVFNQALRYRNTGACDYSVGFDMDGYTIAGREGCPHIASIKGVLADESQFEEGWNRATMRIQAACERWHVRRSRLVMATSRYSAGKIQEFYDPPRPPVIVPEMIDLEVWRQYAERPAPRPGQGKFVVLSVCRFYRRKRLNILLGAAERLRARIGNLEVRIVGGGPEEKNLKNICRTKNLGSIVVWRENISQAELAQEYRGCDVFCLPSVQEGFGIVFLEAMAHGKPIVACHAGATPEVARHALLVRPDEEEELAIAIERLYLDRALLQKLGAEGLQLVHDFKPETVAQRFLTELHKARNPQ